MTPQHLARRLLDAAEQNDLLRQHSRDLAVIRGDLSRILARLAKPRDDAAMPVLDTLTAAAWGAMGARVWTVAELLSRTLTQDQPGLELDAAIRATDREGARSLGQFIARQVLPGTPHQTADGLEIRRCGASHDKLLLYTIGRV